MVKAAKVGCTINVFKVFNVQEHARKSSGLTTFYKSKLYLSYLTRCAITSFYWNGTACGKYKIIIQ